MKHLLAILFLTVLHPGSLEASQLVRHDFAQKHMGTAFRITVYTDVPRELLKPVVDDAFQRVADIDRALSDWNKNSELRNLMRAPKRQWYEVSSDFENAVRSSMFFSELTDGMFDFTLGPLTKLWRLARELKRRPSNEAIRVAKSRTGKKFVSVREKRMALLKNDMALDFGGIGKGIAVDEAFDSLRRAGFNRIMVAGSGDMRVGEAPPEREGWRIGIASLDAHNTDRFIEIENAALSSSGDLAQFVEIEGQRYSHILDPRTGVGVKERSLVVIIALHSTAADAMATAISAGGPKVAPQLARKVKGLEYYLLTDSKTNRSRGFPEIRALHRRVAEGGATQ